MPRERPNRTPLPTPLKPPVTFNQPISPQATIRERGYQLGWEIDTIEKLEAAEFDDPADPRRFHETGDNQLAGVGDGFARDSPAWLDSVRDLRADTAVFGSGIEVAECLTRLVGQANSLLWLGLYLERMAAVIARLGQFYLTCATPRSSES